MSITRREFLGAAAAGAALVQPAARHRPASRVRAVAFDAFALFDPAAVTAAATAAFPDIAPRLLDVWRRRQFEYTWLRVASGRYADFWKVTHDALEFAVNATGVDLKGATRDDLMNAHLRLDAWADAMPVLDALKQSGVRLAMLSNFTSAMLDANLRRTGLAGSFEHSISTDRARTYKPAPRAYRLGVEAFGLKPDEILFVASAGWDAAGAALFGYPTFWANRAAAPVEQLDARPGASGRSLEPLPAIVTGRAANHAG